MTATTRDRRTEQPRVGGGASTTAKLTTSTEFKGQATTMKAIVQDQYGSSEVLELRDIAKPAIGADEVLVRVRAAAVCQHSQRGCRRAAQPK